MVIATATTDYILALVAAIGTVLGSTWAIRGIIKHEVRQCDRRMEAFKEGFLLGEKKSEREK